MRRRSFLGALLLCLSLVLCADEAATGGESSDIPPGFFDDDSSSGDSGTTPAPDSGTSGNTAADTSKTPQSLISEFSTKALTVSGSVSIGAGILGGWYDWPSTDDPSAGLGADPGFSFGPSVSMDVRPDSTVRFHATVGLDYPDEDLNLQISDLFIDYLWNNFASFRLGEYDVTWGNARVFGVSDLPGRLTDAESALFFKSSIPVGKATLTALASMAETPSRTTVGYGGLIDFPVGSLHVGIDCYYQYNHPFRASLTLKAVPFGVDVFADAVLTCDGWGGYSVSAVTGFMREWTAQHFTIYGEYFYNGETGQANVSDALYPRSHGTALALGWKKLWGSSLNASVQWQQSWADYSGIVMAGCSFDAAPHVSAKVLVPCVYGADGSDYVSHQTDTIADLTRGLRLGVEFGVTLSFGF
jgi:hypothetical protein